MRRLARARELFRVWRLYGSPFWQSLKLAWWFSHG